jgi:cation:H+ antiporter
VVAFGTSAPEMAVSLKASLSGQADIALGNVVGSNIFNVLFILGVSALVAPLAVSRQLVRLDVPVMIGVSCLAWWLAQNGVIGRAEGVLLLAGIVAYTGMQVWMGLREARGEPPAEGAPPRSVPGFLRDAALVAVGLVVLVVGARMLVTSAVTMARALGVGEMTIGLTIVAAGTSLPEVAASVMASLKGERDIAVGNVVGSNLFNLLAVLGIAGVAAPGGVAVAASALAFDIPVMVLVALACLPIFFTGHAVTRLEGGLFLCFYVAYTALLVMNASGHAGADVLGRLLLYGALPAVAVFLAGSVAAELRRRPAVSRSPG